MLFIAKMAISQAKAGRGEEERAERKGVIKMLPIRGIASVPTANSETSTVRENSVLAKVLEPESKKERKRERENFMRGKQLARLSHACMCAYVRVKE
jgi:hypothetical protein